MPFFSKQDILHPSVQLSTLLLIILKEIANHWLTLTINNTSENSDGVFSTQTLNTTYS